MLIRNLDASSYFEVFLVSAVATILGTRFYLVLTGFPKVGGAGLHVAHRLWGGLLMLVGIVLLLNFVDGAARKLAALVAGVGFGLFIDEVGKFVTSDNNYFFKPALSLMYITFVALYLAVRFLAQRAVLNKEVYAINSIEAFKECVIRDFDRDDLSHARRFLRNYATDDHLSVSLIDLFSKFHPLVGEPTTVFQKTKVKVLRFYSGLIRRKSFAYYIIAVIHGILPLYKPKLAAHLSI